jgi:hypothetical protein
VGVDLSRDEVSWNVKGHGMKIWYCKAPQHSSKAYLGGVLDLAVGDSERVNSPVQVESVLSLAEWQTFSQSSLINLDDLQRIMMKYCEQP